MRQSRMIGRSMVPVLAALIGLTGVRSASAQREPLPSRDRVSSRQSVTIPADTVVQVRLNDRLSSRNAQVGDRFTAVVDDDDWSGFPEGTRFAGVVSEVQKSSDSRPGILDMQFRQALLPDGRKVPINGHLASLSEEDVRRDADGRILSRRGGGGSRFDPKWVGYGAAGGAVLGTIFGSSFLRGALLGGVGGAIYGYLNRDRGRGEFRDVSLDEGTNFGVRLADRVAFQDANNFRYANRPGRNNPSERVAGRRQVYRFGTPTVRVNGQDVRFTDQQPMMLNGVLYVPLRAVAQQANMRFTHERGEDTFTLQTDQGPVRGTVGEVDLDGRGTRVSDEPLGNAPLSVNGEIYVPVSFLSQVSNMRANWSRRDLRLDLDSGANTRPRDEDR